MLLLPAYLGAHLVWVEDSMIGLPTIRTYHRVVRSATMAFAVAAALVTQMFYDMNSLPWAILIVFSFLMLSMPANIPCHFL